MKILDQIEATSRDPVIEGKKQVNPVINIKQNNNLQILERNFLPNNLLNIVIGFIEN